MNKDEVKARKAAREARKTITDLQDELEEARETIQALHGLPPISKHTACTCKKNNWEYYCPLHGGESGLFIEAFNSLANHIHSWAMRKGFWEAGQDRNDGEMIALIHSELSEALEAIRHGNPPDDKIPEFSGYEAELADVIIRIMDLARARGLRVAEAIIAKMAYNESRPHKHGKEF